MQFPYTNDIVSLHALQEFDYIMLQQNTSIQLVRSFKLQSPAVRLVRDSVDLIVRAV